MSTEQTIIFFGVICITTFLTRALPFAIFPSNKVTPKYIIYLGNVLPFTIIGMLVIYCLKDITIAVSPFAIPEFIAIMVIVILHLWKKNTLLSIGVGTAVYMLLVQLVFQ